MWEDSLLCQVQVHPCVRAWNKQNEDNIPKCSLVLLCYPTCSHSTYIILEVMEMNKLQDPQKATVFFSCRFCSRSTLQVYLSDTQACELAWDHHSPALELENHCCIYPNSCGLLALRTGPPPSQQLKEEDNYWDSSLQFVFGAQLVSGGSEK